MKTKHILFTIALFISVFASAQDKYEFMTINYNTMQKEIVVSTNGKEILRENIELQKPEKTSLNSNPFLIKVLEYQEKDWEVMSFDTYVAISNGFGEPCYIAYLKKKKK